VHDATHVFLKKGVDRVRSLPACLWPHSHNPARV